MDTAVNEAENENACYWESLTVWGRDFSAQHRGEQGLAFHLMDHATRSGEDGHPYMLPPADAVLLRDLLNAATDRGQLPAEVTLSDG